MKLCVQNSTYTQDGRGEQNCVLWREGWEGGTIYTQLYIMGRKDLSKSSKKLCAVCQEPLVL